MHLKRCRWIIEESIVYKTQSFRVNSEQEQARESVKVEEEEEEEEEEAV
jgi:hypothetical protein